MTVYRRPDPIPLPRGRHLETSDGVASVRPDVENLHQLVSRELFTAILRGTFPEGSILPNEHDLGTQLGVSRTALREAIKGLSAKGIVDARRKRGTLVRDRSNWNMLDAEIISWLRRSGSGELVSEHLWRAVQAVLPNLAEMAAERRDGAAIRIALSTLERAEAADGPTAFVTCAAALGRASGNQFLQSLVDSCLRNLLAEDPQGLARRVGRVRVVDLDHLAGFVADGRARDAKVLIRDLTVPQSVELS